MNRKIFIARHGETEWNVTNTYQGWSDNPISEAGKSQVERLKRRLKDEQIKGIFSSPLKRTCQTAEIIADKEKEIIFVDDLKDILISPEFEGKSEEELFKMTASFAKSLKNLDFKLEDGESVREVYERTIRWFDKTRESLKDNFLVVTHEINIQCLVFHLLDLELNPSNAITFKRNLRIRNDRLTIIEEDNRVGFYISINSL